MGWEGPTIQQAHISHRSGYFNPALKDIIIHLQQVKQDLGSVMENEIQRLRESLAAAQALVVEEQRLREEEQRRREEEQRRREAAEEVLKLRTLEPYLESCHRLSLAIKPVTDRSLTTQGETTNPSGRIYPQRIAPWDDFPEKQEIIWKQLHESPFPFKRLFPSEHQMAYVLSSIGSISSEQSLRLFEHETVENAVQRLVTAVYEDPLLRGRFRLRGTVTFESHTNFGITGNLSESSDHTSLAEASAKNDSGRKRHPAKKRGKGNLADQFCICKTSEGANIPVVAIEYKAPHKLSVNEVVTGLSSEIQPDEDIIHKEGEGFEFAAKVLAAAVVTQLFSYMIGKGLQYGYVCTGETFVFLYIPEDPTTVLYHVSVPNLDVVDNDENRLHRTATAQVFGFILQALQKAPVSQDWHDRASTGLKTWAVEYDDVLSKIPASVRKERQTSPYKPQQWRGPYRSPIRTRSSCKNIDAGSGHHQDDQGDDDDEGSVSPSPNPTGRSALPVQNANASSNEPHISGAGQNNTGQGRPYGIEDQPYCTHLCLIGLAYGGPLDNSCPNAANHGPEHISVFDFRDGLRAQLAKDRGPDADCTPLYLSGATGSLLKVRLSASGYTLVAKGVKQAYVEQLEHENKIYDALRSIQGTDIPVCLGLIDLTVPYYYNGDVLEHFLLLSWAGRPLSWCIDQINKNLATTAIQNAFTKIHQLRVLHGDAEPRNILYDKVNRTFMVTDFGEAKLYPRQPLSPISPNRLGRKRKLEQKSETDIFTCEFNCVVDRLSKVLSPWQGSTSRRP